MKHIFKKLHHHPNRSNETPQQPSTPHSPLPPASDNRTSSSSPVAASTISTAAAAHNDSTTSEGNNITSQPQQQHHHYHHHTQQDYYTSEEEYQVQLALALSVSSSGQDSAIIDPEKAPIRTTDNSEAAADLLSRRYWNFGVLDFEERVMDGFYDVYNLSSDSACRGNMPSLTDLESDIGASDYEVVIVNRKIDPALEELMQIAHCIVLDCPKSQITLLIQRLAELVTEHLGGPVRDANSILAKWIERSMELRTSLHTSVLPIGSLRVGLSRHRALLFKALADSVGIPCRLVKGSHYTGIEDDAVNIIKLQDDSECLVDLMGAPGTLIPADALGGRDTPLKSYSTQPSRLPNADTRVLSAQPGQNSLGGYNVPLDTTPWKQEAVMSDASANDGVGTSGLYEVSSPNQLAHGVSQGIGSSLYKGGRGPNLAGDSVRTNVNVVPYSQKTSEDPKYLFADLNPFQIKGPGKTVAQNELSKEAGKMQFSKNNVIGGRPPSPLMWKNRHAWNEVSKENESGFSEGSFGKNNTGTNKGNATLVIPGSSKPLAKADNSADGYVGTYHNNFQLASGESGHSQLSPRKDIRLNNSETYLREDRDIVQKEEPKVEDSGDVITRLHEDKKIMPDRLNMGNGKMVEREGASSSFDRSGNYADTEIDDVGECEIVWEDLVLGERIGLGNADAGLIILLIC